MLYRLPVKGRSLYLSRGGGLSVGEGGGKIEKNVALFVRSKKRHAFTAKKDSMLVENRKGG